MAEVKTSAKDYFILGPEIKNDSGVVETIFALLYLPPNYKLLLPVHKLGDKNLKDKVASMVKANDLGDRVHFIDAETTQGSPEAVASAVLLAARQMA